MNQGFKCTVCEEITDKPTKKSKKDVCPACFNPVEKWERPLSERPGRCTTCARGDMFKLQIIKHKLLRYCQNCAEWFDPGENKVIRKGVSDERGMEGHKRI